MSEIEELLQKSALTTFVKYSPNYTKGRGGNKIIYFTPHCVVGQCSIESLGNVFANKSKQASSNYGIGVDGRVGLFVDECNRSWCTSSSFNDNRAITIECASDSFAPYAFKDIVYKRLIDLAVDVCLRYKKNKLLWLGSKEATLAYTPKENEMLITVHRWFANKSCPGDWLFNRLGEFAESVNRELERQLKLRGVIELQMTKEELKAYIEEVINNMGVGKPASGWAVKEIEKAVENGITDGTNPKVFATREQLIAISERVYEKLSGNNG